LPNANLVGVDTRRPWPPSSAQQNLEAVHALGQAAGQRTLCVCTSGRSVERSWPDPLSWRNAPGAARARQTNSFCMRWLEPCIRHLRRMQSAPTPPTRAFGILSTNGSCTRSGLSDCAPPLSRVPPYVAHAFPRKNRYGGGRDPLRWHRHNPFPRALARLIPEYCSLRAGWQASKS
jgi:hypothetical protein